jgi:hypothetical protein
MFAIDHAATALLVKRRSPSVPLTPLLISVQAMELAWVALNYLGIERTTTEATVRSVADIHLAYMPYSHSVAIPVGAGVLTWLIVEKGFGRAALGRAVGIGLVSHLVLDLATHAHDIVLWPGWSTPKLGLGLYEAAPLAAFVIEFLYGIFCWYVYRGGFGLFALISVGNLANLSFLSPGIRGPEQYLAGRPMLLVTVILLQIVVTLVLVGVLARRKTPEERRTAGPPIPLSEPPSALPGDQGAAPCARRTSAKSIQPRAIARPSSVFPCLFGASRFAPCAVRRPMTASRRDISGCR